jgi:Fe-S-cluster containining protein
VADDELLEEPELEAGDFSAWLTEVETAIGGRGESAVPCAGCTACCTSSQFVPIGPEESDTLAHIPAELLFPAPGLPPGHVVLGYDQRGHCPMLIDHQCSIYEHRPRTCRTYDCRVFPATGVELRSSRTSRIARRVRRWRFSFPHRSDTAEYEAVRSAGAFLIEHRDRLPDSARLLSETQLAVLAIEVHDLFLRRRTDVDDVDAHHVTPTTEAVYDEVVRHVGRRPSL